MQWRIDDSGLTGPIDFETDVSGVVSILGEPIDQFKRTSDSEDVIYAYDNIGVHVCVGGDGKLMELIVFPANQVFIGSTQVLGEPVRAIYSKLHNEGVIVDFEDAGLWCAKEKVLLVEIEGLVDAVEIYR